MKILKRIPIIPVMLVMVLFLSLTVSAALPPTAEIQWQNIKSISCDVFVINNIGTASASIIGNTGSNVQGTATLYETINGVTTVLYTYTTPTNNAFPLARFNYEFEPKSGATYYFEMNGVVSKNGVSETITDFDTITIP